MFSVPYPCVVAVYQKKCNLHNDNADTWHEIPDRKISHDSEFGLLTLLSLFVVEWDQSNEEVQHVKINGPLAPSAAEMTPVYIMIWKKK